MAAAILAILTPKTAAGEVTSNYKISWPHGTNFTDRSPTIAEAVRRLPVGARSSIDGEAIAFRSNGHSDFAALRTRASGAGRFFRRVRSLEPNEDDLRPRPLEERREALSRLVAGIDGIIFSEAIAAEGALVFAKACAMGLEGIVSNGVGGRYWSGRSRQWLKSKNPEFSR